MFAVYAQAGALEHHAEFAPRVDVFSSADSGLGVRHEYQKKLENRGLAHSISLGIHYGQTIKTDLHLTR